MKKALPLLLVLVLLAVSVTPALAAGKPPANSHGNNPAAAANTGKPPANQHADKTTPAQRPDKLHGNQNPGKPAVAPSTDDETGDTGKPAHMPNPHAAVVLRGTVGAFDPISNTVTITVTKSNAIARRLLGDSTTLTLTTTAATRFLLGTDSGTQQGTFDDLTVGQNVHVQGRAAGDVWSIRHFLIGLGVGEQP